MDPNASNEKKPLFPLSIVPFWGPPRQEKVGGSFVAGPPNLTIELKRRWELTRRLRTRPAQRLKSN
jgi:hypothetical protein